jgi:hypothetical protein
MFEKSQINTMKLTPESVSVTYHVCELIGGAEQELVNI